MNPCWRVALAVVGAVLLSGCHVRYSAPEVVPLELLEVYKQDGAEVPARVQVVNFVVNSVDANYSDDGKDTFRRYQSHQIPKRLYELLGATRAFREVRRSASANPELADYVVSGTYDYSEKRIKAPYYHEISMKGTIRVRVVRAKDNTVILEKAYLEERSDSASSFQPIRVIYLQEAYLRPIAVEIRSSIAQDMGASRQSSIRLVR